jgi:hypothetical protein
MRAFFLFDGHTTAARHTEGSLTDSRESLVLDGIAAYYVFPLDKADDMIQSAIRVTTPSPLQTSFLRIASVHTANLGGRRPRAIESIVFDPAVRFGNFSRAGIGLVV